MHSSPYLSHSGYGQRTYGRSNSSGGGYGFGDSTLGSYNNTSDGLSSYYRSKYIIPEDGPAKSFLAPRYTPSSVATGYQLNRYKSSDNVPDSSYLSDYKLKKSTSATSFLPSNTHSLLKNYNSGETTSRQLPISQLRSRYIDNLHSPTDTSKPFMNKKLDDRKFAGKYGGGGESTYASAYLTRINKGRDSKPREIDTRDINVTEKPKNPKWLTTDRRRDDEGGTISRNRQVVRLTIKREKVEPEDPFTIRNKTLQTMAQRLIDKYQVPVKKQYEPETLVKRRLPYQRLPSPKDEKPLILPLTKISRTPNPVSSAAASTTTAAAAVPEIAVPVLQTRPATQITPKDPPLALQSPQRLKTTTSAEEKDDDAALVLQRATATAETKDKLESWQEVKDAIYAAVLHPDVDIESDEEIDKLMKGGEKSSPEGSKKDKDTKREAESRRGDGDDDEDVEEREGKREEKGGGGGGEEGRRGETSDSLKGKGKAIVGQLKKFVRQQESTNRSRKKRSKKRSSRGSRGSRKGDGEEKSSGMAKDNLVGKTSDKDGVVVETEKPLIPPPSSTSTSTTNTSDRLVEERCEKKNTDRVKDSSLTQDPDDKTMTKEEEALGNKAKVSVADKGKNAVKEKKDSLLSPDIVMKTVKKKPKVTKTIKDGVGEEAGDTTDKDKESQASKYTNRKDSRSLLSADLVLDNLALGNESRDGEESNAKGKEAEASGEKLPQAGKFEKTPAGLPEGKKDQSSDTQSTKIPKIKWKLKKTTTTTTTTEDEKETTSETLQKQSGGFPDGPPPSLLPISSSSSPSLSQSSISPPLPSTTSAPSLFSSTFATGEKQTNSKQKDEHQTGANTTWDKQQTDVKSVNEEQTGIIPEGKMKDVNKDTVGWRRQAGINKLQPLADPDNNNKTSSVAAKPSAIPRKTEESAKMNVSAPWRIKKEDKATTLREKDEGEREYYTRKPLQETDTTKPQVKDDDDNKNKEFYTRTPVDNKLIKPKLNSSSVPDEDNSNKEEKVPEKKIPAWKISRKAIQEKSATQPTTTTTTYKDKVSNRTLEKEQKTATPSDRTEADNRTDSKTDTTTTTTTTTTTSSGEGEERGGGGVEEKDVRNDEVSKLRGDREGQNKVTIKDLKGKGREDSNEGEAKRDKLGLPPRPDTTPVKKALKRPRQVVPPPAPKEDATNELLKARSILKRPNKQSISAKKETGGATGAPDQSSSGETTTTTTTVPWRKPVAPLVPSNQGEQIQGARNILKPPVKPKADSKPAEQEDDKVLDSKAKLSAKKDERKQDERENEKVKKTESSKPAEESVEEKQEATPKVKKLGVKKSATGVPSESPVTAAGKEPMKLEPRGRPLRKQVLSPSSAAARTRSISSSSSSSSSFFSSSSDSEDGYEANSTVRKKVEKPRRPLKARAAAGVTGKAAPQSPKSSSSSSLLGGSLYKKKITDTTTSPVPTTTAKTATLAKTTKPSVAENAKQNNKDATTAKEDEKKDTELSTGVVLPRQEAEEGGAGGEVRAAASQSADSGYGSCPSTPQPTHTAPDPKEEQEEEVVVEEEVKVEVEVEVVEEEQCTVCGTNCHKKCEKQMPNLCGVNQKLLAEALSSVKKGGSADGTTRTLAASPTKTSHSSVSGSSETEASTEDETDTTDTESDYFGLPEIRPPLQTCPKFKKYNLEDFHFIKVLGKGSYGKVMLAQQKDTENYFAVKCLKKDVVLEDNDVECTLIERKVLSLGTKHPYLCHLFCTFQTPSHLFFVMEYLTGGDLMFHIQHCGRFDEFRSCFYAAEITSGLKFLHGKGIIYRDLKLDNILLDYQGHIRIADFGMCKLQVYLDRYADTFCGTPDYMAPEVIKGQHYNQCVDWWSFGVLLYEMLTGKSPFKGCDEDHLFWLICNDEPFFPKFLSKEAANILKALLDKDSTRRLGIPFSPYGEITVHPFFKYIDWHKIERKEVETPYKPRLRHILDVQYFDPLFTKRHAAITPLDESILATMDQTPFTDFSYTNPNITD